MTTQSRYALCGLLLVTCGILPAWAQIPAPRDQSAEACPGTLASVREGCGCDPRDEAAFNALKQTGINDANLRSQVRYCFNLDGNADIKKLKLDGHAGLKGCLEKLENQFPQYQTALAKLVEDAHEVPATKVEAWNCCYAGKIGQSLRGCQSAGKPASKSLKAESRSDSKGATSTTTTPPSTGIQQQVKATSGHVKTGTIEASHEGKSGVDNIQQTIEASGDGVIETGDLKAHVGP